MKTREEAQKELLDSIENQIKSGEKNWGDTAVWSPKKGKNSWTFREMYDAITKDIEPEEYGGNPIDTLLRYYEWKDKKNKNE